MLLDQNRGIEPLCSMIVNVSYSANVIKGVVDLSAPYGLIMKILFKRKKQNASRRSVLFFAFLYCCDFAWCPAVTMDKSGECVEHRGGSLERAIIIST